MGKIQEIDHPTHVQCLVAIEQNIEAMPIILDKVNVDDEFLAKCLKLNGLVLQYIPIQTEEICLAAVTNHYKALKYVKNKTRDVCLRALKTFYWAIKYIENPTREYKMISESYRLKRQYGDYDSERFIKYYDEKFK